MPDIVCIKKFADRHGADIAKSVLDANAIKSYIQSDDAGGMYPFMTEGIRLFVQKKDKEKALIVLKGI